MSINDPANIPVNQPMPGAGMPNGPIDKSKPQPAKAPEVNSAQPAPDAGKTPPANVDLARSPKEDTFVKSTN